MNKSLLEAGVPDIMKYIPEMLDLLKKEIENL
jgi:hypothetical protein